MPDVPAAVPVSFSLVTTLVLHPGGVASLRSPACIDAFPAPDAAWKAVIDRAALLGSTVPVVVTGVEATATAWLAAPDGSLTMTSGRHLVPEASGDPAWEAGLPRAHDRLVDEICVLDRAGSWQQARAAAGMLTGRIRAEAGAGHPHTVLAQELEAHLALRAGEWGSAVELLTAVAAARHVLGAPVGPGRQALYNATAALLRLPAGVDRDRLGLELAHTLAAVAPVESARVLTVVLTHTCAPAISS